VARADYSLEREIEQVRTQRHQQRTGRRRAAVDRLHHRDAIRHRLGAGAARIGNAQEGIAGTQRQEPQRDALNHGASRKNTVEDFVSGAITTDGKKAPVALIVGLAGKLHGVARTRRSDNIDLQPFLAQTRQSRSGEFRGAAATGGGVDDGEETIHFERERTQNSNFRSTQLFPNWLYNGRIAAALSSFARRSAKSLRLILREAVRGKSSSSRTTP